MKVAIDLTSLLAQATGVDVSLRQLVTHLGRLDRKNDYTIFVNYEDRFSLKEALPDNFRIAPSCLRSRSVRFSFQQAWLPVAARALGIQVIHSPSFLMPYYRGRQRHLLTIHDMTFFTLPDFHTSLRRSWAFRRMILSSIRRADLVNVPSRSVKDDVLKLVPDVPTNRIRIIPFGIDDEFQPMQSIEKMRIAIEQLRLPQRYILFVGTIEPRKNLPCLLEGYRNLIHDKKVTEHLVLAGRLGWGYKTMLEQIENSSDLRDRVHLPGYISEKDLPMLYAGARLFVYPSLHEGFGFPPLEAMACGVPTIASRGSALSENLKGAAELVSPNNSNELTSAMKKLLTDQEAREVYRAKGLVRAAEFRWETTAKEMLSCYEELANGKK